MFGDKVKCSFKGHTFAYETQGKALPKFSVDLLIYVAATD